MKLKWLQYYSERCKKGDKVEIDKIRFDPGFVGFYKVRVVNVWKKPRWIAISWFVKFDYEKTR